MWRTTKLNYSSSIVRSCAKLASDANMAVDTGIHNPFAGDEDFLYLALDKKKMMEEAPPFDAKTTCWIVDNKEGYMRANIKATKGDDVTVITDKSEVGILLCASHLPCKTQCLFVCVFVFVRSCTSTPFEAELPNLVCTWG